MHDRENIDEDNHDYSPNELARLSVNNPEKYERIVRQNIPEDLTGREWENRNLEFMQRLFKQ